MTDLDHRAIALNYVLRLSPRERKDFLSSAEFAAQQNNKAQFSQAMAEAFEAAHTDTIDGDNA